MMRHGWLIVVLTVFITSCGNKEEKQNGPARWSSFPVSIYVDPNLVNSAQSQRDFEDAMAFWEQRVGTKKFPVSGKRKSWPQKFTKNIPLRFIATAATEASKSISLAVATRCTEKMTIEPGGLNGNM